MRFEMYQDSLPGFVLNQLLQLYSHVFGSNPNVLYRKMKQNSPLLIFAAFENDTLAGFKMGYDREPGHHYSWMGCVDPAFRRKKVASTLMRLQHSWLRNQQYKVVETHTYNKWREMLLLNVQSGFSVASVDMDQSGQAKIIMTKSLLPPHKDRKQLAPRLLNVIHLATDDMIEGELLTSSDFLKASFTCLEEDKWLMGLVMPYGPFDKEASTGTAMTFSYGSVHFPAMTKELYDIFHQALFEMEKTGNDILDLFHVIRAFHHNQPPSWQNALEKMGEEEVKQQLLQPRDMIIDLTMLPENEDHSLTEVSIKDESDDQVVALKDMAEQQAGITYPNHSDGMYYVIKEAGEPLGLAYRYMTPPGQIGHVFVRSGFRQKHLGTTLLTSILEDMQNEGYRYSIIYRSYVHAFFEKTFHAMPVPVPFFKRTLSFSRPWPVLDEKKDLSHE
ncbi:GNAT family N-acetyltransferase [Aureibacillus halotolerans]|uniref:Acetyltransferase (GNAT) family protein n=1 Tax=Aureibacillus halotolerans TaxID=1508390 RepID=A0A4V3D5K6_9BACI|nr:GNAT family N-acetyltransferase [Aureibacillus halotolerans]TDQ40407.1 acetyltransferase (GNAT) family protein [Aureibacillus halotolerans]